MFLLTMKRFKFFTVLLSTFALLNLQIGVVYAEAESSSIQQDRANRAGVTASSANGGEGSGQQAQPAKRTKEVDLDKTSAGMADMIYFLVLIAMSLFVASLWRFQPMPTDMRIAMAAAVVMLGSEMISVFQTRAKIDAGNYKVEVSEDGTVNNMQVDALKKQKESYEQLKKHGELKWKIQAAGAVAYTVAGTMAHMLGAKMVTGQGACFAGLSANFCPAALTLYKSEQSIFWTTEIPSEVSAPKIRALRDSLGGAILECVGPPTPTPTPASKAAAVKAAAIACNPYIGLVAGEPLKVAPDPNVASGSSYMNGIDPIQQLLFPIENLYVIKNHLPEFLTEDREHDDLSFLNLSEKFFVIATPSSSHKTDSPLSFAEMLEGIILPKANALAIGQLGIAASLIVIFIAIYRKGFVWMNKLMINPTYRGNVYLAVAAASGVAMMITRKSVGQAEDNIKKIDELLARFDRLQRMKVANLEKRFQNTTLAGRLDPRDFTGTRISDNGRRFPCPPTVGRVSSGCPSIEKDIKESPSIGDFGPVIGNLATLSGRVADGFSGQDGLSAGTIENIDSLGSNLALAQRMSRQVQEQINEGRKKSGLAPHDFQKEQQAILDSIGADIKQELERQNISNGQIASAFNGSLPASSADTITKEEDLKLLTTAVAPKGGANMANVKAPVFDFTFGDEGLEEIPLDDTFAYSDEMYAKAFEENQSAGGTSQIVGNRDVSLFQVISVRYMKSGLPRLLDQLE